MRKLGQQVRELLPMAAIILLCLVIVPSAQASTNNNGTAATTTQQNASPAAPLAPDEDGTKAPKPKAKATNKPGSKSVLDAEVLDSPISYFKHAFSSEENDADATPSAGPVVVTVKALVATLLSTIL